MQQFFLMLFGELETVQVVQTLSNTGWGVIVAEEYTLSVQVSDSVFKKDAAGNYGEVHGNAWQQPDGFTA